MGLRPGGACRAVGIAMLTGLATTGLPASASAGTPFSGTFTSVSCASVGNCTAVGTGKVTTYSGNSAAAVTSVAAVTQTNGAWGSVIAPPQPADADTTASNVGPSFGSVACPAAGNCDASGLYPTSQSGSLTYKVLFAGQRAGSWSQATGEATPASTTPAGARIACGAVGDCAAIVDYSDNQGNVASLLETETHGTWGPLVAPTLPSGVSVPYLADISCSAPGECVAVGEDTGPGRQGLLFTESGGTWGAGTIAPLPSGASGVVYISSISCPATGSCTAVGGLSGQQGLLFDETNGSWRATAVAPPTDAYSSASTPMSVSCASAGNCTAVGLYVRDNNDDQGPLLLTETNGTWAQAVTAGATTYAPNFFFSQPGFIGVSCAAPGSCSAAFGLTDNFITDDTILLNQTGGTWGPVVMPTPPPGGSSPFIDGISCPAAGDCTAVGSFSASGQSDPEGLVLSESGGTWGQGTSPTISGGSGGGGGGGGGGSGGGGSGGGSGSGQPAIPHVTALSIKPATFVLTGRRVHGRCVATSRGNRHNRACARKIALRIALRLTTAARVTVTIKRELPGRRVGGRCVTPSRVNRRARKCIRSVPVRGKLTRSGKQGLSAFIFNGTLGGHSLGAGSYLLSVTPSAGGKTGTPRIVSFQLIRGS